MGLGRRIFEEVQPHPTGELHLFLPASAVAGQQVIEVVVVVVVVVVVPTKLQKQ